MTSTPLQPAQIPLALYIHMPWCIKKCPYCDFNSHAVPDGQLDAVLESDYLDALLADAAQQVTWAQGRPISSVFIGGGTPSLISAAGYDRLFQRLRLLFSFSHDCEVTLEANPSSVEHAPFAEYLAVGINRLSLGVQTFDDPMLKILGRVHGAREAQRAIGQARAAGFERVNVDLMHGLPSQTVEQAVLDLQTAIAAGATHVSWYQLTIEPNTVFFRTQPRLPDEERLAEIQCAGEAVLRAHGFVPYEVSAWRQEQPCRHNLNYWQFGDYLAIGAGAHGKVTWPDRIERYQKTRLPKDYLAESPALAKQVQRITAEDLPFEFMMNALRLHDGVVSELFAARTGLALTRVLPVIQQLQAQGLLVDDPTRLQCTAQGMNYLNGVLAQFVD
ncbi:MAG: radical SAM family heme chaperone HemW [Pseudomonadota bacterium]|nr:radical SAM family heme chaperone HemW [Pseudomonadota bacterium]